MPGPLSGRRRDFSALSVGDLLAARAAYHLHLLSLDHVVATAIGRFRIRHDDPDFEDPRGAVDDRPRGAAGPRTLTNSGVRPWSWPCILVYVDTWLDLEGVRKQPDALVPGFLYLPDGRVVPTCVIEVKRLPRPVPEGPPRLPSGVFGGGYPIVTTSQGWDRVGTIGCLVSDGGTIYALTSRHVLGDPGEELIAKIGGGEPRALGVASAKRIDKKPLSEVYPGFVGDRQYVNLDVGLLKIHDLRSWTAQVYGIGELDTVVDLHPTSLDLKLVGQPVRAHGGVSGPLRGEIHGFFFRYRTIGGIDYVADILIGQRSEEYPLGTVPGDSGTLWFLDWEGTQNEDGGMMAQQRGVRAVRRHPLAIQWGGQVYASSGTAWPFALATSLSTACRELDVEIVQDWDVGLSEYWGKVGHYKIAAMACTLLTNPKLDQLMTANLPNIGVPDGEIEAGELPMAGDAFIPLADVADLVWRQKRQKDAANHFADMDEEGHGEFAGATLLALWKDGKARTPASWTKFYDQLEVATGKNIKDRHRGALPFRIWEMYDGMVAAIAAGKVEEFVCIGGLMAHFVGDACQPLHVSHLHHGRPGHDDEQDVHSIYETKMLDRFAGEVVKAVNDQLKNQKGKPKVKTGAEAADHVVKLMANTIETLPPIEVIEAFNGEDGRDRIPHMWELLGPRTVTCLAAGALTLAELWESAWKAGKGNDLDAGQLGKVPRATLKELYLTKSFIESRWLREMTLEP